MGMAYKSPEGYKRKFIIGNVVVDKLRSIVPDFASWPGGDVGNYLDVAVDMARASPANVERWWEDSFSYGIQQYAVVRFDIEMVQAVAELYAITTVIAEGSEGGREIIVTVIDEDERARAIVDGRWRKRPPARSRYRHPGELLVVAEVDEAPSQSLRVPMAELLKKEPIMVAERTPNLGTLTSELAMAEFALSWEKDNRIHFEIVKDPKDAIEMLISDGVSSASIRVWRSVETRIKVVVEF